MALYYPPKQGLKGWRSVHWAGGVIPDSLANAIVSAQLVSKEAIYDSNSGWLILDSKGNTPSKINMDIQAQSQVERANYYGLTTTPTTIKITKSAGSYIPEQYFQQNWFVKNWRWLLPLGIGAVILSIPDKRNRNANY